MGQNPLPRLASLRLVDGSGVTIRTLSSTARTIVDLSILPPVWTIVADAQPGTPVQSVGFTRDGAGVRVENASPYAYAGDSPPGNFTTPVIPTGLYPVGAIPWSAGNAAGVRGVPIEADLHVLRSDIAVNRTADLPDAAPGNGVCEATAGAANCTLRAAVEESNARAGAQTIGVPPGDYPLTLGQLRITSETSVQALHGQARIRQTTSSSRVLEILPDPGTTPIVNLQGLHISGGRTDSFDRGAGIMIWPGAYVQMFDATVSDNLSNQYGGGIYVHGANLLARDVVVRDNRVGTGGFTGGGVTQTGGGIASVNSTVTLEGVRIEGNRALRAGGLYLANGRLRMSNSIVARNAVGNGAGGLLVQGNGIDQGIADISYSTITLNEANAPGGGGDDANRRKGGGIFNQTGRVNMANSILAGNIDHQSTLAPEYSPDCASETIFTFTSFRGNVLGRRTPNCIFRDTIWGDPPIFDQVGTPAAPLLVQLDPFSYVPLAASPALDRGNGVTGVSVFDCPATDIRGISRPRDGDGDGSAVCDVGALER